MIRLLHVVSDSKNNNLHVRMAQKDAEISALKAKVSELYAQNDELGRENRKLSMHAVTNIGTEWCGMKRIL